MGKFIRLICINIFLLLISPVDSFNVGLDLTISMEVRPRSLNGILFSVHGKGDFVALQLVSGEVCHGTISG